MLLAHGTVSDNQNVLHRYIQQDAQGVEVIDGRQAHAALPAVNGLRCFKPEIGLKVADGQTPFLPKTKDIRAGCAQSMTGKACCSIMFASCIFGCKERIGTGAVGPETARPARDSAEVKTIIIKTARKIKGMKKK